MFTLARWILGPTAMIALLGYMIYQNTYNTPEARIQRTMTSGIEHLQKAVSKYTGAELPKEKSLLEKVQISFGKGMEAVNKHIDAASPALAKTVDSISKEAKTTYHKATGTSSTNVTRYNQRTENHGQ